MYWTKIPGQDMVIVVMSSNEQQPIRPEKRMRNTPSHSILLLLCAGNVLLFCAFTAFGQDDPRKIRGMARELYQEGVFYGKQGKYVQAEMALEQAIELYPAYADAYNALGVVYQRQHQNNKAAEQYLLAIEAEPKHVKARTNLAIIYSDRRQYQKAARQLEKALEIQPDYAPARKLIGSARNKAAEQAAKELERQQKAAQRSKPPSINTSRKQHVAEQKVQRKQKTSRTATNPQTSSPPFAAGTTLCRAGKLDAGIQAYRDALGRFPHSAEGYTLLAMAYREQFRITRDARWYQQELEAFTAALEYDDHYVPAQIGLGELLFEQGYVIAASMYFEDALLYQPSHPAKDQLQAILQDGQK